MEEYEILITSEVESEKNRQINCRHSFHLRLSFIIFLIRIKSREPREPRQPETTQTTQQTQQTQRATRDTLE